jgi:hypothetical protein
MTANIVGFSCKMICTRTRMVKHQSNKVFRGVIIIVDFDEIVFRKFKDNSMEDEKSTSDIFVEFSTEGTDFMPMGTHEGMSWTVFIFNEVFVYFILHVKQVKGDNTVSRVSLIPVSPK